MSEIIAQDKTTLPHHLCATCEDFWSRATCLQYTGEELYEGGPQTPTMPQHLLHSQKGSQIHSSAQAGCHFCSIILGSVSGCTGEHKNQQSLLNDNPVYVQIAVLDNDSGTFVLTLFPCEQSRIYTHDLMMNNYPLQLRPSEYQPATTNIEELNRVVWQTSTFSNATAEFIKLWLLECQNEHPLCGDDHFDALHGKTITSGPRRLLDIQGLQDPAKIRLVDTKDLSDFSYCALSYSWGFSTAYSLTSLNMSEFRCQIFLNDLPRTIKEAIEIARDIGFRYLWIDALCILQDGKTCPASSADWVDQVNKLHDIFGNSVVTIAASESFDGTKGLIHPRNPLSQTTCRLHVKGGLSFEVIPPCTPHCLSHPFYNARYHLDSRAWVFQERILSPRTIHITRNFVHLECRTELRCELEPAVGTCSHSGAVPKADYHTLFALLGPSLDDTAAEFFLSSWHALVRKYSITDLCRPEDLLLAMSGLATRIQKRMQLTWFEILREYWLRSLAMFGLASPIQKTLQLTWSFGLWREYLLRDMLWYVRGGKGKPIRERAPTWSWASIELKGPEILYEAATTIELVAKLITLPKISRFEPQVPLKEYEAKYAVKIAGPLKQCGQRAMKTMSNDSLVHPNCQGLHHIHMECPFHPDFDLPKDINVCLLLIARIPGDKFPNRAFNGHEVEIGLVLTPDPEVTGLFRRVGYFHHMHKPGVTPSTPDYLSLCSWFGDGDAKIHEVEII